MAISIAPSQWWEGNDGPWSTFAVQIGTPAQVVRVLPSTSQSSVWVVLPEGCQAEPDPSDCVTLRGVLFRPENSSSYKRVGDADQFFELPFDPEASFGFSGNSIVGFDNVTLGWDGSKSPVLGGQVVTGFATKQPFLGVLGLTPYPVNITDFIDQHPSPLGTLVSTEAIPSTYWAYTAGKRYTQPERYGSLTFGGYDAARGNVNDVLSVPLGVNTYRDLVVAIQSIGISKAGGSTTTESASIYSFIDSTVPEIWLPVAICERFEAAFNLTWNETFSMYFVDDDLHEQLSTSGMSVILTLSANTDDGSSTTSITLPYASFDLTASYPLAGLAANQSQRYFPLKRAQNESQYVLGRTFLQETYLAVDYDRSEFYVSQATVPSNVSSSDLRTVEPLGDIDAAGLSPGTIAGIAVGILVFTVAVMAAWWYWRRRRRTSPPESQPMNSFGAITASDHARIHAGNHINHNSTTNVRHIYLRRQRDLPEMHSGSPVPLLAPRSHNGDGR